MDSASQSENTDVSIIDNINEQLDETILTNQDDFIERNTNLQSDIESGVFVTEVLTGKRTVKNKLLKEEIFDTSVYVQNQCGFLTTRPLFWVQAVDKYVNKCENTLAKYFYKPTKHDNKYYAVKILISYQSTKKIEIIVNLTSGVFIVKGTNYRNWIQDEVPKLLTTNLLQNILTVQPQSGDKTNAQEETKPNSIDNDDSIHKELKALWDFVKYNKVAIDNHDLSIQNLNNDVLSWADNQSKLQAELLKFKAELEEAYDKKISIFMTTITEETKKDCDAIRTQIERRINDIKVKTGEFQANITSRLNDFFSSHEAVKDNINQVRTLKEEIDLQKEGIKEVIQNYRAFNDDEREFTSTRSLKDKLEELNSYVTNQKVMEKGNAEIHKNINKLHS